LAGLNTLAGDLITKVNAIHSTGYGLDNNPIGKNFFNGTDAGSIAVNTAITVNNIATSSALNQPGNNDIARQIAALKNFKNPDNLTMNEYYAAQVNDLAVATRRATDNNTQYGLVSKALDDQRESIVGVSLDEEAAKMAQSQKAYQAAARVMTVYDDLLDTVINRMGLVGR
jgi:flagellar hook-associated protein 1 FlgK